MSSLTLLMYLFSPYLVLPILLMISLGGLAVYLRRKRQQSLSLRQSLQRFKISLILLAVSCTITAVLAYSLTATLQQFGYPSGPEDVQTAEQVLSYIQQYHRALITNTHVLIWLFYGLTTCFLTILYTFAKAVVSAILSAPYNRLPS